MTAPGGWLVGSLRKQRRNLLNMGKKEKARALLTRWSTDYDFKTFINSSGSMLVTAAFAAYNGFLGIAHSSYWHGSICVYYFLLLLLRFIVLQAERVSNGLPDADQRRRRAVLIASLLLLLLNLCLIGPFFLMVRQKKPVTLTLIPAIAMAAYTTLKVTMAAVNLKRKGRSVNCLVRFLRTINFIDALLSVVTLQNTLIMVNDADGGKSMLPLVAATSGLIWGAMLVLSLRELIGEWRHVHGGR